MLKSCLAALAALALTSGAASAQQYQTVYFAGGNYWYLEKSFDEVPGVMKARSGYIGGTSPNPTYQSVTNGGSGYKMAVEVTFDPKTVSYKQILDVYWHSTDPTDQGGQFCDRGDQYLPVIYYSNDTEKAAAQKSQIAAAGEIDDKGISTRIQPATEFFPAEDYHQDYHAKEGYKYDFNRKRCRVDEKLEDVWGSDANVDED